MKGRKYRAESSLPLNGFEVQRPTRPPSWESDVAVPLGQAVVTSVILGSSLSAGLWYFAQIPLWPTWAVAVIGALAAAWLWRMGAAGSTLWVVERVLGTDLNRDGEVGQPEAHFVTIRANGSQSPPEDPAMRLRGEFVTFVRGCVASRDTSLRRWEEAGMSRQKYQEFRDRLIGAGFAEWRDPSQPRRGWVITASLETILENIM